VEWLQVQALDSNTSTEKKEKQLRWTIWLVRENYYLHGLFNCFYLEDKINAGIEIEYSFYDYQKKKILMLLH
jgi:hypothetical protein